MTENVHSTGRGGAGNIGTDASSYADGAIVHEGVYGESKENKDYSAGRGGAGNIGKSPLVRPAEGPGGHADNDDVVPETALKPQSGAAYHSGRGGQGNAIKTHEGGAEKATVAKDGETKKEGLMDKVKHLLHKDK